MFKTYHKCRSCSKKHTSETGDVIFACNILAADTFSLDTGPFDSWPTLHHTKTQAVDNSKSSNHLQKKKQRTIHPGVFTLKF